MDVLRTEIPGLLILQPRKFGDERGFFVETYRESRCREAGIPPFVQDNWSRSQRGTLRGLHYQLTQPQGKLVQVLRGAVYDVVVDLRKASPTFGKWFGIELNDNVFQQMYVPPGFAHGFCVLSESADFYYRCTAYYAPEDERTLLWNDSTVGIEWPELTPRIMSGRDQAGKPWGVAEVYEEAAGLL